MGPLTLMAGKAPGDSVYMVAESTTKGTESAELPPPAMLHGCKDWESPAWLVADKARRVVTPGLCCRWATAASPCRPRRPVDTAAAERSGEVSGRIELFDFTPEEGRLIPQHDVENRVPHRSRGVPT